MVSEEMISVVSMDSSLPHASETPVAIVIAAGQATRLQPYSDERPKALMELAPDFTIIDFIIKQFLQVGIQDIIVATRSAHRDAFEKYVEGRAKVLVVDDDQLGNLSTVVAATRIVGDRPFLLAMSDHIFEIEILRRLLKADDSGRGILLCVDTQPNHRDLREGLRVHASRRKIHLVGKTIPPYSGVDVGLFLVRNDIREIASALNSEKAGEATISDLVNILAADGEVGYVDVTGRVWMDIDTPDDLLEARRRHKDIMRRDLCRPTDGPISRWLNRPISSRMSLFVFQHVSWATPNMFTVFGFVLAMVSAFLIAQSQLIIGAVLVHFSSLLDGVDGELARLRGRVTAFGTLLDSLLDRVADISLVIALGFLLAPGTTRLVLTGLGVFGVVLVSYVSQLAAKHTDIGEVRGGFPWATRDVRLFVIAAGALVLEPIIPIVFCAAAPLAFALRVLHKVTSVDERRSHLESKISVRTGIPLPEISSAEPASHSHKIRENAENLLASLLKIVAALIVLQLAKNILDQTPLEIYLPPPIDVGFVFDMTRMVVLVYFGYKLLMSVKFFADLAADFVVPRLQITRSMYTRATVDFLYLVIAGISWSVITPIIAKLPEIGSLVLLPTNLAFLSLSILLLYDMLRMLHRGLKGRWDAVISGLADRLASSLQPTDDDHVDRD